MGARAHLAIHYPGGGTVWLYAHWRGAEVPEAARRALRRGRDRWRDAAYLARIAFDELTWDAEDPVAGFGILLRRAADADLDDVHLDVARQEVARVSPDGRVVARRSFAEFTEGAAL